jgi:CheY-like chemotaxis protein
MRSLTILYVEDYKLLLNYVKEMLEAQGWRVDACRDGASALAKIESQISYDVMLFDDSLTDMSGLELARRARSLAHRRRTPIIMLSVGGFARAAHQAGADVFLKKPEDVDAIIGTINRLMVVR